MSTNKDTVMTDQDNTSIGLTIDDGDLSSDLSGEVNHGFVLDDERKEDTIVSLPNVREDDRESDYYSGSPNDSLKNIDDDTDAISDLGRTTEGKSSLKSRLYCKNEVLSEAKLNIQSKQKWRDLTMGTSFVYAICLTIIYLALLISDNLPAETITQNTLLTFLVVMFTISILAIGVFFTLSALGKLTNDEHYKKRGKSTFIRGGMLVLGSGMIIFSSLTVATYVHEDEDCREPLILATSVLAIIFAVGQIAFLLIYNKIRINNSLLLSIAGRYMVMQIIATNLCVWLGAVFAETLEEISTQNSDSHSESLFDDDSVHRAVQVDLQYTDAYFKAMDFMEGYRLKDDIIACNSTGLHISHILTPYLFPLMIEFCVMASCMCLAVWENCGIGWLKLSPTEPQESAIGNTASTSADADSLFAITKSETSSQNQGNTRAHQPSHYFNNNTGFVFGWVVIVGSLVIIVLVLYYLYSGANAEIKESMMYGLNLALSAVCLIAIPLTMYSMSKLTFKDDEIRALRNTIHTQETNTTNAPSSYKGIHRKTDKSLLFNTYIAMMTLKLFVMIAAYEMDEPVIFVDGIISIFFGFLQTLFINWYAFQKRATTEEDRKIKPGRQGLEFLRCANFALWLVNTFLLRNKKAKRVMYETFGFNAWAILSNIFQPLTILYYFHAMMCLAEVIGHSYTAKYVGVTRPWKRPKVQQRQHRLEASYSLKNIHFLPSAEFTAL